MRRITPSDTRLINPNVLLYCLTYVGLPASSILCALIVLKKHCEQESIPVGCVPSAAVTVVGGVPVGGTGCTCRGAVPARGVPTHPGAVSQHALRQTPPLWRE